MNNETVRAGVLLIGDELLSGRTGDINLRHIARCLTAHGIDVCESRVVRDDCDAIISAVNALRFCYDYVFTTGGIGPTHDDITADSIARAFGVEIDYDSRAVEILRNYYGEDSLTSARLRMARIPFGASLIENSVSGAPGFFIENVYVMAGIPKIMSAMLDFILPDLRFGSRTLSDEVFFPFGESFISEEICLIRDSFSSLPIIFSVYPSESSDGVYSCRVVVRSKDAILLEKGILRVKNVLFKLDLS